MALLSFAQIGQLVAQGKVHYQNAYKPTVPSQGSSTRFFVDLNQTAGIPKYNAFAGSQLAFNSLTGSGNAGIYPGSFIPGSTKHLLRWQVVNVSSGSSGPPDYYFLCDYLGFYPLIDGDDTSEQICDNTNSLTRYESGEGVRIVLITQAPMANTANLTIKYTNSDGVTGRTSTFAVIAGSSIGVCVTGSGTGSGTAERATPFWPLAEGDKGVRAIESFTLESTSSGFFCAALVKPIATIQNLETGVSTEKLFCFDTMSMPEIKEGAYLNVFLHKSLQGGVQQFRSEFVFVNT